MYTPSSDSSDLPPKSQIQSVATSKNASVTLNDHTSDNATHVMGMVKDTPVCAFVVGLTKATNHMVSVSRVLSSNI